MRRHMGVGQASPALIGLISPPVRRSIGSEVTGDAVDQADRLSDTFGNGALGEALRQGRSALLRWRDRQPRPEPCLDTPGTGSGFSGWIAGTRRRRPQ